MSEAKKIRVLVADDHYVVRHGLSSIVDMQEDMQVVAQANDGEEAILQYAKVEPDVMLLDLRMPKKDGVKVVEHLAAHFKNARILIMTTYSGEEDIRRCLMAGARGYLLKAAPPEQLLDAIRRVHRGENFIAPDVAHRMASSLSSPHLTERELAVLRLIAEGKSNKQIGRVLNITEGTAKTHVNNIFSKLDASGRTEAVIIAARRGLVQVHD